MLRLYWSLPRRSSQRHRWSGLCAIWKVCCNPRERGQLWHMMIGVYGASRFVPLVTFQLAPLQKSKWLWWIVDVEARLEAQGSAGQTKNEKLSTYTIGRFESSPDYRRDASSSVLMNSPKIVLRSITAFFNLRSDSRGMVRFEAEEFKLWKFWKIQIYLFLNISIFASNMSF